MTIQGYMLDDRGAYSSVIEENELGQETGHRWARVHAPSSGLARSWSGLPQRGTPFDDEHPNLVARRYSITPDGGEWWKIRITYGTASGSFQKLEEPAFTAGLRYTVYGQEESSITVENDIDGNPLNEGGAQAIVRYPLLTIVHHRTTPFPVTLALGLVPAGTQQSVFAIQNSEPTPVPRQEWDLPGEDGAVVFNPGELLYLRTGEPEYQGGSRFIVRHYLRAAPDFKHYWYEREGENGPRVEKSGEIYPSGDLRVLWA